MRPLQVGWRINPKSQLDELREQNDGKRKGKRRRACKFILPPHSAAHLATPLSCQFELRCPVIAFLGLQRSAPSMDGE